MNYSFEEKPALRPIDTLLTILRKSMKQIVNKEQQQLYYNSEQTSLYWWLQQKQRQRVQQH